MIKFIQILIKYPIVKGEQHGNSILTEKKVIEIRSKYIPFQYSAKKLSLEYNVSQSCITHVLNNTTWKNLVK